MHDEPIRILLVEDEEDHVFLVRRAFDSCSMAVEISTASNLAESRLRLAESPPDLLITDICLSDGKGLELLPTDEEAPPFATIVITGHGDEATAVEAMKAGALDYIVKSPSTFSDMPRIAERVLQQWRQRKELSGARKRHRNNLEKQVQTRTEELAKTNKKLREEIGERKLLENTLRYRSDFENLVAALSTHFINLRLDQIDKGIQHALKVIGAFVGADRSYVFQLSADDKTFENTHEWSRTGIDSHANQFQKIPLDRLPWWSGGEHNFEIVHIPCVSGLPPEETPAKKYLPSRNTKSLIAVPLTCRNQLVGLVGFDSVTVEKTWSSEHVALLNIVGELFANVLDRQKTDQELQREKQFLRELIDLQERDRKLVAYEIHDGLAQKLAGALLRLQSIAPQAKEEHGKTYDMLQAGLDLLTQSVDETRRLISGLRPPILDESGIIAAIDYLVCEQRQQCSSEIAFEHQLGCRRLAPPLETALFRIVQEALANACRHSHTDKIQVTLAEEDGQVRLTVRDWGIGFKPKDIPHECYGLRGIQERVQLLGGQAVVESSPQQGTCISVKLPLLQNV